MQPAKGAGQQAGRQGRVGLDLRDGELKVAVECLCRCTPCGVIRGDASLVITRNKGQLLERRVISPTHKRAEGRAPVWGSEFTSKRRRTTGGDPAETAVG
jgi:hypothetical protein